MKIKKLGEPKAIISAPNEHRNYFGWPTICITKDKKIAVACSGYRLDHVCPFGKAIITFSSDGGRTFSQPVPVIDTVLDDRDAGLCPFGENGLILTSFNNTVSFQRENCIELDECYEYLDSVKPEDEAAALGAEFIISRDNGKTWGKILHSPITSPHGPVQLKEGRILWVGTVFSTEERTDTGVELIQIYEIDENGNMTLTGKIDNITENGIALYSCEPHMIELDDGSLICHIRVQNGNPHYFTVYQSKSTDGGKTWSKPRPLLERDGGSPAHLLLTSGNILISAYGYRKMPYGIRVMFSTDRGESWQTDEILYEQQVSGDLGYPATVELDDGTFLTVFYAHEKSDDEPAVIMAQKWQITD